MFSQSTIPILFLLFFSNKIIEGMQEIKEIDNEEEMCSNFEPLELYSYNKKLIKAVKNEDIKKIILCLEACADPNYKSPDYFGMTSLMVECSKYEQNISIITLLLNYKTSINIHSDKTGTTPLIEACRGNHHYRTNQYDTIALLLEHKASINMPNKLTGTTPLMKACNREITLPSIKILHLLLEQKADPNLCDTTLGGTALHRLCGNVDLKKNPKILKIIHLFLTYKANIFIKNNRGWRCLSEEELFTICPPCKSIFHTETLKILCDNTTICPTCKKIIKEEN